LRPESGLLSRSAISRIGFLLAAFLVMNVLFLHLGGPNEMLNIPSWWDMNWIMEKHGFFRVWTPYPPVMPLITYTGYRLLKADPIYIAWAWRGANLVLLGLSGWLLYELTERKRPLVPIAYLLWSMSWASLVLVGVWCDHEENLILVLVLLALLLLQRRHTAGASVATGLAVMTKLFPLALVLATPRALGAKRWGRYAAGCAVVCLSVAAPFLIADPAIFLSSFRWTADRGPWESVYAFPAEPREAMPPMIFLRPGMEGLVARSEMVEWLRSGGKKLYWEWRLTTPYERSRPFEPLTLLPILGFLACAGLVALSPGGTLVTRTLGVLVFLLLFSKGFSSYFILWIVPLLFLEYGEIMGFVLGCALLLLGNLVVFALVKDSYALFWTAIFARHVLLCGVGLHLVLRGRGPRTAV